MTCRFAYVFFFFSQRFTLHDQRDFFFLYGFNKTHYKTIRLDYETSRRRRRRRRRFKLT